MKISKVPENYRQSQLHSRSLVDKYDCHFPVRSNYYDREPIGFQFSKQVEEKISVSYIY